MTVLGHGVDLVDCARIKQSMARHGQRFLRRVFTPAELEYCLGKKREIEHLSGRFAAKEAVLKVLGTGWSKGINWTDIEIRNDPAGRPWVSLAGECSRIATKLGMTDVLISISHIKTHAVASAIACGRAPQAADASEQVS